MRNSYMSIYAISFFLGLFLFIGFKPLATEMTEPVSQAPTHKLPPRLNKMTLPNGLKVAFVGDTGAGPGFLRVLKLIKAEKADLVVVLGDTDYGSTEAKWDRMIKEVLGDEAALLVIGNHDRTESNPEAVIKLGKARLAKNPQIKCEGAYG